MNRFVILCDCGEAGAAAAWWAPAGARQVVAIIDDMRPGGPFRLESNYFGGPHGNVSRGGWAYGHAVESNRFGEHRDPLHLRCPGTCRYKCPRIRESTAEVVVDAIDTSLLEKIEFHESDQPASERDAELFRREVEAAVMGEPYDGELPTLVPTYVQRLVIPWKVFTYGITKLTKDRPRELRNRAP